LKKEGEDEREESDRIDEMRGEKREGGRGKKGDRQYTKKNGATTRRIRGRDGPEEERREGRTRVFGVVRRGAV